jgi:hypothetical protein
MLKTAKAIGRPNNPDNPKEMIPYFLFMTHIFVRTSTPTPTNNAKTPCTDLDLTNMNKSKNNAIE